MLELEEQMENFESPQLNVVQCIEDLNINKSSGQQEQEVLFQEFIKGIPDQCIREMHVQDTNFQNDVCNGDKRQCNQLQNENREKSCDIQQLSDMSSIPLIQQGQDQIPNIQNQFLQNGNEQELDQQNDSQKLDSLLKFSDENDQNLSFNAGFGDFLKEMQRLAKDLSFEKDTHDIWTETSQNKDENCPQSLIQLQQSNQQKIESTYVIDFSQEKVKNGPIDKLITQVEQVSKGFIKKQNMDKTEELNLSEKEREYIKKLQQIFTLGQQIRNFKQKMFIQN